MILTPFSASKFVSLGLQN